MSQAEYDDSQRLDEMETAEDYNRFEEEQVFLDREAEDDDDFLFRIGNTVRAINDPTWIGTVNTYDTSQNDLHITDRHGDDFWSDADGWEVVP
jgi:hypothetical protein